MGFNISCKISGCVCVGGGGGGGGKEENISKCYLLKFLVHGQFSQRMIWPAQFDPDNLA